VNNLKLGQKMLVLSFILMASILVLAFVALNRLVVVNAQVRRLVDRTILKRSIASELQADFLSSIRGQKNSILSPDDERSEAFAAASRLNVTRARASLNRLKDLATADHIEGQLTAVEAVGKSLESYEKINNDGLRLSVQHTNTKARSLLETEIVPNINIIADHIQIWIGETTSRSNPGTTDLLRLKTLNEIGFALKELYPTTIKLIESSSEEVKTALEKKLAELQDSIKSGLSNASGGEPTSQVETRTALASIKMTYAHLIKLSKLDTNNRSTMISLGEARTAVEQTLARLGELDQLLENEARSGRDLSESVYTSGFSWILGVALAGVIFGGLFAYFLTKRIVTEVQNVSETLARSSGDLTGVSNQLISQSDHASLKATSVASAAEQLSMNISKMAAAAEEMSVSLSSISSASEEMSFNVGTISSAAEQTSTNVSVVSTAVGEISNSFADVLKDVREGSTIAGDASRMADSATETIQLLNRSGAEISKVTETIKMIALQTNPLALNATIEATSAGEAGKGFAVVAHEIKELANQSAKAAEDIARKIEGVQNNTRQAVEVIQNVSQIIKDINASAGRISLSVEKQTRAATMISQNVGEANKGVGDIARSISEVAKAAGDMSRNVAEAARGATDVSRNVGEAAKAAGGISSDIHGVSDASKSTNESASKVNSSAVHLDQIGKELKKLVGRFKLSTEDTSAE